MRFLLLNQFFWPDAAATGQLLADVARELKARGCAATVVCGKSGYARGNGAAAPAVEIRRAGGVGFRRSAVGRICSYGTFLAGAAWQGLRGERPDVIVTLTTPPGLSVVGAALGKLRGARHYTWEMDVYPDVALALGMGGVGWSRGLLEAARKRAAGVIALGECMAERLRASGVEAGKIHVAENWADGEAIRPEAFPEGPLTVLYSGNLGLAHEVETVKGAMVRLRGDERVRFVFAGGGPAREELKEFCRKEELKRVVFREYCEVGELGRSLAEGHVGLVTQKRETLGCVVPSKVYGVMAAGRGVLYVGPGEATPGRIVTRFGCGWQVEPGDVEGLVGVLERLAGNRGEFEEAGRRGRRAFEEHYERRVGVERICEILGAPGGRRGSN